MKKLVFMLLVIGGCTSYRLGSYVKISEDSYGVVVGRDEKFVHIQPEDYPYKMEKDGTYVILFNPTYLDSLNE